MTFRSGALAMLTGTVIAQAIPLLASPLLTRLYSPEAFGLQTLFMGIAASLAVCATCRLDLAVVLPESDEEALVLANLILSMIFAVCVASLVAVAVAGPALASMSGYSDHLVWLWALPLMVAAIALAQLLSAFSSRQRDFVRIAKANVINQTGYAMAAVVIGLSTAWTEGLAISKVAGQSLGTLVLGLVGRRDLPVVLKRCSLEAMCAAALKYRQFIFFNTPYSLVGTIARDAPIFILSAFTAVAAAGYYGLARTVLLAPTLLTSNALSQVFFREAVALRGSPQLERLTMSLLLIGLLAAAPFFAFCAIWGDQLFAMLFGEKWRTAGTFAMLLAPAAWLSIQTGWPERLFEVNKRQGVSFSVQLGSDVLTATFFFAAFFITREPVLAVGVFSLCNVLYHHAYLVAIFRISGFSFASLAGALISGWSVFIIACGVSFCLRVMSGGTHLAAVASMLLCSFAAAGLAWFLWQRNLTQERAFERKT